MTQKRLSRPTHQRDRFGSRQPADVDEPDERFDPDRGADGSYQLSRLILGKITFHVVQGLGDPSNGTALTQWERSAFRCCLERQVTRVAAGDTELTASGAVDMGRVQASARKNGGIEILGPPPFGGTIV